MICDKCNETGELKVFDSFQYYYCLGCKEEIKLISTGTQLLYDILNVSEDEQLPASFDWLLGLYTNYYYNLSGGFIAIPNCNHIVAPRTSHWCGKRI